MNASLEDKEFVIQFGHNLRLIRRSKGLSMELLAFKADLDYSQIGKIERGIVNTTISTSNKIAKALEIPVKDLFDF